MFAQSGLIEKEQPIRGRAGGGESAGGGLFPSGQIEPLRDVAHGRLGIFRLAEPIALALERIGWHRHAITALVRVEAGPIDGCAAYPQLTKRREHGSSWGRCVLSGGKRM